jgi:putative membrane protein
MTTIQIGQQAVPLEAHVDIIVLCVGLIAVYIGLIRKYQPILAPDGEPIVSVRQRVWFGLGVLSLWVASGSPLHTLADQYLFSAHMLQHLVQAFVLAPLFIMGTPGWMLEVITRPVWIRSFLRTFGAPLIAGLLFNVVLLGIHWPVVVALMVNSALFHAVMHLTLVLASLLMWLPLLSNSEEVVPRMAPLARMGYLFAMTILPTVPASFLTFAPLDRPLFPVYDQFPRIWEYMTVGQDMLVAGLLMKTGGGFLLWGIIATMFFRWALAEERREHARPHAPAPSDAPDVPAPVDAS